MARVCTAIGWSLLGNSRRERLNTPMKDLRMEHCHDNDHSKSAAEAHPCAEAGNPQPQNAAYRVGPGFPPREHQFKPGHSGNPDGARKRPPSIAPDLKALLQAALSKKVTLTIGDKERVLTKAAAGIEQLVDQFARGDRYARRDLFDLADKLGLDLGASSKAALEELAGKALTAEDQALVTDFLKRRAGLTSNEIEADTSCNDPLKPATKKGELAS